MIIIPAQRVEQLIKQATAGRWEKDPSIRTQLGLWDTQFRCLTKEELLELSAPFFERYADKVTSKAEAFDCEDYALCYSGLVRAEAASQFSTTAGLAIGLIAGFFVWVKAGTEFHMCNWVVMDVLGTETFMLVEPQLSPKTNGFEKWVRPASEVSGIRLMFV